MSFIKRLYDKRNSFKQSLMGKRVIFHHVPKCAGTSVSRALRTSYFLSEHSMAAKGTIDVLEQQYGDLDVGSIEDLNRLRRFRIELLNYLMWKDIFYIGGHVPFSVNAYRHFQGYHLITVLRNPVERYISEYFYNYQRKHQFGIKTDFEEYLNSPLGQRNALKFCEYFCGSTELSLDDPSQLVEQAKENLQRFSVIGFTENMEQFEARVRKTLGIRASFGVQNKRTASDKDVSNIVTPELRAQLTKMCRFDQEIYDYAWQLAERDTVNEVRSA